MKDYKTVYNETVQNRLQWKITKPFAIKKYITLSL